MLIEDLEAIQHYKVTLKVYGNLMMIMIAVMVVRSFYVFVQVILYRPDLIVLTMT